MATVFRLISRISISGQFALIAVLGMGLTVSGLFVTIKQTHDFAYEAKRKEIRLEAEEAASIVRRFVKLEQSGGMARPQAQKSALDVISSIRFDKVNYINVLQFDGLVIANPSPGLRGTNGMGLKDVLGQPIITPQIAIAKSGKPGFTQFHWVKLGEKKPKLKISYVIGIPEWQWVLSTGSYADDLDALITTSVIQVAEIFLPLFLIYLAIAYGLHRSVASLLGSLADAMARMSQGQLDTEIVGRGRKDELGGMADALVAFRDAGLEKFELQKRSHQQQMMIEQQRLDDEAARARVAKDQAQVVGTVGLGLAKLSAGDLTFRIQEAFSAEYETLRVDYNSAMHKLHDTMTTVTYRTARLKGGSNEITQASDDLAGRTERQAASLEETAAALDEITATVRKTADGAVQARGVVAAAKANAEQSAVVVRQAVDAMSQIEESSRSIGEIIGMIDEIAFQTNLLALNAGIEAARVGDAGRGFAVVASEVRGLAQRSTGAAKEIKILISASARQVAEGVERVGETGKALDVIVTQMGQINTVVGEIAASAQEQATGLHEVNSAVNQMDQVTQQNAAMVEQTTAAAHSLRGESDSLSDIISQFQVDDERAKVSNLKVGFQQKTQSKPQTTRTPTLSVA